VGAPPHRGNQNKPQTGDSWFHHFFFFLAFFFFFFGVGYLYPAIGYPLVRVRYEVDQQGGQDRRDGPNRRAIEPTPSGD